MLKTISAYFEAFGQKFEIFFGSYSGIVYMIAQALFFSIQNVFIKIVAKIPALQLTFFRGFGMFIVNEFIINDKNLDVYPKERLLSNLLIVRGFLGFIHTAFILLSFTMITLVDSITIYNILPVLAGIAGSIFLNEPFTIHEIIAAIISFIGFLFVVKGPDVFSIFTSEGAVQSNEEQGFLSTRTQGALCSLISTSSMVAATILIRKVRERVNSFVSMQYLATGGICLAPIFMFSNYKTFPNLFEAMCIVFIVLFSYFAEICRTRGIMLEKAATGAILNYTQIIFTLIWNYLFLKEEVTKWTLLGIVFIFAGGYLVIKYKQK